MNLGIIELLIDFKLGMMIPVSIKNIFFQKENEILPDFEKSLKDDFYASLDLVDFSDNKV